MHKVLVCCDTTQRILVHPGGDGGEDGGWEWISEESPFTILEIENDLA